MRISDWSSDVCSSDLLDSLCQTQTIDIFAGAVQCSGVLVSCYDLAQPALRQHRRQHAAACSNVKGKIRGRSEEHTSELQSLMRNSYAVFCLKKKKHKTAQDHITSYMYNTRHNTRHTYDI